MKMWLVITIEREYCIGKSMLLNMDGNNGNDVLWSILINQWLSFFQYIYKQLFMVQFGCTSFSIKLHCARCLPGVLRLFASFTGMGMGLGTLPSKSLVVGDVNIH